MAVAGVIVAAIIGAAATGISAGMASSSQKEAQRESKNLANTLRGDTLGAQEESKALTREGMAQNERQFLQGLEFQKQQFKQGVNERADATAYNRKRDTYQNALSLLNNNLALQDRTAKYFGGR